MGGGGRPQHQQLLHPEKVQKDPAHRERLRPEEGKGGAPGGGPFESDLEETGV